MTTPNTHWCTVLDDPVLGFVVDCACGWTSGWHRDSATAVEAGRQHTAQAEPPTRITTDYPGSPNGTRN